MKPKFTQFFLLLLFPPLLSLAPQPSLGLGLLHKIWQNFSVASQQFSILQGRVVIPTPTHIPEDQASVFISPRGRVAQLYPWTPILVASYDTQGLRCDYSYSPVTTRGTNSFKFHNRLYYRKYKGIAQFYYQHVSNVVQKRNP
jgi:hypothetical protein